jgi:uncharacterized protein (TIGR03067 family)
MPALLIWLFVLAADPLSKEAAKELESLKGEWVLERLDANGQMNDIKLEDRPIITINGTTWKIHKNDNPILVTQIDPTTQPKLIDLKTPDGDDKHTLREGIYKIEGDTLHLCLFVGGGRERPAGFEKAGSEETVLAILRRKKD